MRRRLPNLLLLFILSVCLPAAAPAQPPRLPPDTSVLARTGIVFPERLGVFVRAGLGSVETGRIDAHYVLPDGGPDSTVVDIYISRIHQPQADEFASTEGMIRSLYTDLVALRDLRPPPAAPGAVGRLWRGNLRGQPVLTGMILSHRNGWRIKLRATVPAARGEEGWAEVEGLIAAFDWAVPRL